MHESSLCQENALRILLFSMKHNSTAFISFVYLEHIQGTTFIALTNHQLADHVGILSHQHVLETVDLNQRQNPSLYKDSL